MKPSFLRLRNVFAAVLLTVALATIALAHNKLMKTAPAAGATVGSAPTRVELWFAEKPDLPTTKISVKGPAGAAELGPIHATSDTSAAADFKGKLGDGQYTVSWQTSGDDGHVSKGDFSFSVKSTQ